MKKLSVTQLFVLAVIILAGCKKDDNPGTAPEKSMYLPVSVYYEYDNNGTTERMAVDSLVYNADNMPVTLFTDQLANGQWGHHFQFTYNSQQQVSSVSWFSGNNPAGELDSLVYNGNQATIFKLDPTDHQLRDKTFMTFSNDVLLVGSKDTLVEIDTKLLRYTEFTYKNGNPVHVLQHRYETYFGEVSANITNESSYTYDGNLSPFRDVYTGNPYLMSIMYEDEDAFSMGKNSVTSLTRKGDYGNGTVNFSNTYDAEGTLTSQVVTAGSDSYTIRYSYIKRK